MMKKVLMVVGLVSVAACSSDPVSAPPRVTMDVSLGPGNETGVNDSAKCLLTSETWDVGDPSTPVTDGTTWVQPSDTDQIHRNVGVTCIVKDQSAGKYLVQVATTLQGRGSLTVNGLLTAEGTQQGIKATITNPDFGAFTAEKSDCTVDYKFVPESAGPPVTDGRVWGTITCPHMTNSDSGRTCQVVSTFKFENCQKQ